MGDDVEALVACCKHEPDSVVLRRNDCKTPRNFRIHFQLWWGSYHLEGWGDTLVAAWQQLDSRIMRGAGSEYINLEAYKTARDAGKFGELSFFGHATRAQI